MKKHTAKPAVTSESPPEPSHLDDTLTRVTRGAAAFLKEWRIPILAGVCVVVLVAVGVSIASSLRERTRIGINQRLYELFEKPMAARAGTSSPFAGLMGEEDDEPAYTPPEGEVQALIDMARGTNLEPIVLQTVGEHYLARGERAQRTIDRKLADARRAEAAAKTPPEPKTEPETETKPEPKPDPAEARKQLEAEVARLTSERDAQFARVLKVTDDAQGTAGDPDLQRWATSVRARIEGMQRTDWLPKEEPPTSEPPKTDPPKSEPAEAPPAEPKPSEALQEPPAAAGAGAADGSSSPSSETFLPPAASEPPEASKEAPAGAS